MKYPKINTIWKRDQKTHKIIEGEYSKKEFENINLWRVSEKIDGTNIRVIFERKLDKLYDGSDWQVTLVEFKGRTDNAQIPKHLKEYLEKTFTEKKLKDVFPTTSKVILYGEGYGKKIQSDKYKLKDEVSFILFDVFIDRYWLEYDNVKDIAQKLNIRVVSDLGIMTIDDVIKNVKDRSESMLKKGIVTEGYVVRSEPLMLFRDGTPIMWKLKVKDYGQPPA